ncbi:MAG: SRPBCC family protein [Arenicellales bacterium]
MAAKLLVMAVFVPSAASAYDLSVTKVGKTYHAFAVAHVNAAPEAVHAALLDFSHFTELSPNITVVRVLRRPDPASAVVYMEVRSCVLIFCETLKQQKKFTEPSATRIMAITLPDGSNVRKGSDSWTVTPEGRGSRLQWAAAVEPDFRLPTLVGTAFIRRELEDQGRSFIQGIERLARSKEAAGRWSMVCRGRTALE